MGEKEILVKKNANNQQTKNKAKATLETTHENVLKTEDVF